MRAHLALVDTLKLDLIVVQIVRQYFKIMFVPHLVVAVSLAIVGSVQVNLINISN